MLLTRTGGGQTGLSFLERFDNGRRPNEFPPLPSFSHPWPFSQPWPFPHSPSS